jgi:hypothetical protein
MSEEQKKGKGSKRKAATAPKGKKAKAQKDDACSNCLKWIRWNSDLLTLDLRTLTITNKETKDEIKLDLKPTVTVYFGNQEYCGWCNLQLNTEDVRAAVAQSDKKVAAGMWAKIFAKSDEYNGPDSDDEPGPSLDLKKLEAAGMASTKAHNIVPLAEELTHQQQTLGRGWHERAMFQVTFADKTCKEVKKAVDKAKEFSSVECDDSFSFAFDSIPSFPYSVSSCCGDQSHEKGQNICNQMLFTLPLPIPLSVGCQ